MQHGASCPQGVVTACKVGTELGGCVKVVVVVLDSPSLIVTVLLVSVDVKQH